MMTDSEAGSILKTAYDTAPRGEATLRVRLFGVRFASSLAHMSVREVVARSGLPASYVAEVYKGMRLAGYVAIREDVSLGW